MVYCRTQTASLVRVAGTLGAVALAAAAVQAPPSERWGLAVAAALTGAAAALLTSLTVVVDDEAVRWRFGPGLVRRSVPLDEVAAVAVVRPSPLHGWGIRWIPRGWLYRVGGLDAVELRLHSGRRVVIGTDDPEGLRAAVEEACAAV